MTLREEIINLSGETLEEGKIKNFFIGSLIAAAAVFAAVKGYPVVKQAKTAMSVSSYDKYKNADYGANNLDIKGNYKWSNVHFDTYYNEYKKKASLRITIYMNSYGDYIVTDKSNETRVKKMVENEVLDQLDVYIKTLKENSSKLEKYINKDNYIGDNNIEIELDFRLDTWRNRDGEERVKEFCKDIAPELARQVATKVESDTNSVKAYVGLEKINIR